MEIHLYDHRNESYGIDGFHQYLGKFTRFFFTRTGELNIRKGDLLYSMRIHFTKKETEALRERLNEMTMTSGRQRYNKIISEAEEILKKRKR